jgi:hypothetical protein
MEHPPPQTVVKDDSNKFTETAINERRDSRVELTDKDAITASKLGLAFSDATA